MSKKILTVFGATGKQGGSVINTILSHPQLSTQFSLRAITRNTSSDKAKALSSRGVELATADLDKASTLNSALKDSYAVFAVTNFWETQSRETEVSQGKAIADACVEAGVKHIVWSSLPNVTKLTNGTLKQVGHFDGKSEVEDYIESIKSKTSMIATYFMPGFYMSNIKQSIRPAHDTGIPTLSLPWNAEKTRVALLDEPVDTGSYVAGIFAAPDASALDGKHIHAVSEWLNPTQIVETISSISGTKVNFQELPAEVFQSFLPEQIAAELTENMVLVRDYSYYGLDSEKDQAKNEKVVTDAGLKVSSFKAYVEANGPWEWK